MSPRHFVPSMRDGWQFPSGWGNTIANRNAGRVYLTAPKPLHNTSIYDDALRHVRARHWDAVVISARDAFTSRIDWLERRGAVLAGVTQLYVLAGSDNSIGPGVGWELAFARSANNPATIRALKALLIDGELTLSIGADREGYRVLGTSPKFSDYRKWDAGPARARLILERPALSLVAASMGSARGSFQPSNSHRGYPDEEETTA